MRTSNLLLLPALIFLTGFLTAAEKKSFVIEGTVLARQSGKPLANVHVYIIHGEEEALTNDKGVFRIESWQKLPARLTVDARGYKTATVNITDPAQKQQVQLVELR